MPNLRCKALLLAAGLGTRLRPLTNTIPKCLIPVDGKPLLDYWFDAISKVAIQDVLINTHHLRHKVQEYLETKRSNTLCITEFYEPTLLGSAGTIHANADWMEDADHCVVIYADNFSDVDLGNLIARHVDSHAEFTMLLFEAPDPTQCGIVELDEQQYVTRFEEKPSKPRSKLANAGIYVMSAALYRDIGNMNAFDLGLDVLPNLVGRIHGLVHPGYHRDVGTYESLAKIEADLGLRVAR